MIRVEFSFPEWFRLFTIVLHVPYSNAATEREIRPLAEKLEPTEAEKAAWGWAEEINPLTGATSYRLAERQVLTWGGHIEREFEPVEVERLRYFVNNPPPEIPWRLIERQLRENLLRKLGGGL